MTQNCPFIPKRSCNIISASCAAMCQTTSPHSTPPKGGMQQSARLILSDVSATGIELCKWATWLGLRAPSVMDAVIRAMGDLDEGVGWPLANVTSRHAPCCLMWAQCFADTEEPHHGIRVIILLA